MLCNPIEILWSLKNTNEVRFARLFSRLPSLLDDLHHLKAWERWFNKKDKGCSQRKGNIIPKLRQIVRSRTEADMNKAIKDCEFSKFWKQKSYPKATIDLISEVSTILLTCSNF